MIKNHFSYTIFLKVGFKTIFIGYLWIWNEISKVSYRKKWFLVISGYNETIENIGKRSFHIFNSNIYREILNENLKLFINNLFLIIFSKTAMEPLKKRKSIPQFSYFLYVIHIFKGKNYKNYFQSPITSLKYSVCSTKRLMDYLVHTRFKC